VRISDRYLVKQIDMVDNAAMAAVIRQGLIEFGADRPGFAWQDPELDDLHHAYRSEAVNYWVINGPDRGVVGGGGIGVLGGLEQCCELQKMHILSAHRGFGIGAKLIDTALNFAAIHYCWCYLETLAGMTSAATLYRRSGFTRLPQPIGQTGHNACDHWYIKELQK